MSDIGVVLPDFDRDFTEKIGREVEREARKIAQETLARARASHAFKDHTGTLRRSGEAGTEGSFADGDLEIYVRFTAPYAGHVEHGTKAHDIKPRQMSGPLRKGQSRKRLTGDRVLAFEMGGKTVFAKKVHHPGTQPTHFLQDALRPDEAARRLGEAVQRGSGK